MIELCYPFLETCATLEARGLKETTQSNIDILISPCDPDLRPPTILQVSAEADLIDMDTNKAHRAQLEVDVSKVPQEAADVINTGGEECSELLLVGEDRMYPTLRSKSLNTNPKKTRTKMKESEAMPRLAGSFKDLKSVFSEGVVGTGQSGHSPGSGTSTTDS